jgi:hypothetical protein
MLKKLESNILAIQTVHPAYKNFSVEMRLLQEYEEVQLQNEIFWHQRSRVRWVTLRDKTHNFSIMFPR